MSYPTGSNQYNGKGYTTSGSALHPSPVPPTISYHAPVRRELLDIGIFKDTILPSLQLHAPLAIVAYGVGRATNSVEAKDWLWPIAPVLNGWWSAIGRKVYQRGLTSSQAFGTLSRPERLLLTGVTLWGGRLFYRIASRSIKRRRQGKGTDDPRYEIEKLEEGYWNKALLTLFLPEALIQTIISLPVTAPFHHQGAVLTGYHPALQALAVGLFCAGFTLEVLADTQLEKFKDSARDSTSVCKEGVWSLVRHPNYLGDALVHLSFPLLLYGSDMLAPVEVLGGIANYLFLRYVGGDKQTERHQARRYSESSPEKFADFQRRKETHNSFWPKADVLTNQWLWVVVGAGVAGAVVEQVFQYIF
ncbi:hypothetical protein GQX73_g1671 [Xylaria multiplex]|uniref:Uncharacterized protein n=1 Tax=Xylaria multiplex TaxID=323545 RepID=A0A7C8J045_9PEZI|nr:hypothetical protein GQX73_g1671 [Xylaria multiplex]